jgi:hypothetical protein
MATGLNIINPPDDLTMTRFFATSDADGSLAKECRFIVRILPVGASVANMASNMGDLMYLCDAAEFPGRGMDLMTPRYYGPEFNLPRNSKYPESIDLSIICRSESNERKMFDDWMDIINPVDNFNFQYRANYVARIDVFQFAEYPNVRKATAPKAVYQWSLNDAWPMNVAEQQVTWANQDVLRLSVSFTYRYWSRPTPPT